MMEIMNIMDIKKPLGDVSAKTTLFHCLAQAFNYPDTLLSANLSSGQFINDLDGVLPPGLQGIGDALSVCLDIDPDQLLLDLEKDYTWMFLASKPRVAYLFGSVYSEGKLYQESTFEIARLYHQAGLKLDESFKLPPDHIALELEFMAYLVYSEEKAVRQGNRENEELAFELQQKLADNYLAPLAINVGERIEGRARTAFYRCMGRLLRTLFAPA